MKSFHLLLHTTAPFRWYKSLMAFCLLLACSTSLMAFTPHNFIINVTRMNPMGYPSKDVSYGYALRLKNDSVQLQLPYMGRAYQLPYGGGDGLNFKEPIKDFKNKSTKKGAYRITFTARHEMSNYQFYIEVYPENESAYINIVSSTCEAISYLGRLETEKK